MSFPSKLLGIWRNPRPYFTWEKYRQSYIHRCILPGLTEVELHGIRLNISKISPAMKNAIYSKSYEACEVAMCDSILNSQDRILELGSAIGFIGIYCTKKLGTTRYYSVEANPEIAAILRENYRLNGLEANLLEAAVSDQRGEINFFLGDNFWASSTIEPNASLPQKKITVKSLPLQDIIAGIPFECTTMIIDIEGGECSIRPDQIPSSIRKLIIELHPDIIGIPEMFDYLARLISAGFKVVAYSHTSFSLLR